MAVALLLGALATGCGDDAAGSDLEDVTNGTHSDVVNPYDPDNFAPDTAEVDDDAPEPIYPGHPCDDDDVCSTGLCWGTATSQGAFNPRVCQTRCITIEDYGKYCDSDSDCCSGRCCVGCGPQEGLCLRD